MQGKRQKFCLDKKDGTETRKEMRRMIIVDPESQKTFEEMARLRRENEELRLVIAESAEGLEKALLFGRMDVVENIKDYLKESLKKS